MFKYKSARCFGLPSQTCAATRRLNMVLSTATILLLGGCASQVKTADDLDFHGHFDSGDFRGAAAAAMAAGHIGDDGKTENMVWSLNAGAALFNAGDRRAVAVLDTTEKLAQANDLNRVHAAVDYTYTTYDGVMTNMYKALAFVQQGDKDDARVEFNRVEDRQRKAEELFNDEIAASEAHRETKSAKFSAALDAAQQSPAYASANAQLSELAAYAPFENPFATYMAGVFFVNENDFSKGIDRLKRAAQVLGPNSQAASDVIWAEHNHSHPTGHASAPSVWVVFENGQSATYHEMRIVLPMVTGAPMTLAMPVLALNAPAYTSLEVVAGGVTVSTTPAGSFDAVMASEFNRRRPLILGEAVAEVLAKNVGSALAEKSDNPLLKLTMLVVANVSTADTRSWTALPKEFQAVRVAAPADGNIAVLGPDGQSLANVTVPVDRPSIVYVKLQRTGATAGVQILPL